MQSEVHITSTCMASGMQSEVNGSFRKDGISDVLMACPSTRALLVYYLLVACTAHTTGKLCTSGMPSTRH